MWQLWHGKETLAIVVLVQDSLIDALVVSGRSNMKHVKLYQRQPHLKKILKQIS